MEIIKDSNKVLEYVYDHPECSSAQIIEKLKWDKERVFIALKYLEGRYRIEVGVKAMGRNWHIINVTPYGIDIVEENRKDKEKKKEIKPKGKQETEKLEVKQYNEIIERLNIIKNNIGCINSRKSREINYKTLLYSLVIASLLAIGFTSFLEIIKLFFPIQRYTIPYGLFLYFLILSALLWIAVYIKKMRECFDVAEYFIELKIPTEKTKREIFEVIKKLREIFEVNGQKIDKYLKSNFEGRFINGFVFYFKNRRTDIKRQEEILIENFMKEIKGLFYEFKYKGNKNIISYIKLDFDQKTVSISMNREIPYKIANKILSEILSEFKEISVIESKGLDQNEN